MMKKHESEFCELSSFGQVWLYRPQCFHSLETLSTQSTSPYPKKRNNNHVGSENVPQINQRKEDPWGGCTERSLRHGKKKERGQWGSGGLLAVACASSSSSALQSVPGASNFKFVSILGRISVKLQSKLGGFAKAHSVGVKTKFFIKGLLSLRGVDDPPPNRMVWRVNRAELRPLEDGDRGHSVFWKPPAGY
eukprot:1154640-Pelagomonas_calceolata.AAC.3